MTRDDDAIWFGLRPRRLMRIRKPVASEFAEQWQALGMHNADRRHVLIWRVPPDNPGIRLIRDGLMRIPFLAFADESIEDSDAVLLPMLDGIMREAAKQQSEAGLITTGAPSFEGWKQGEIIDLTEDNPYVQ